MLQGKKNALENYTFKKSLKEKTRHIIHGEVALPKLP